MIIIIINNIFSRNNDRYRDRNRDIDEETDRKKLLINKCLVLLF